MAREEEREAEAAPGPVRGQAPGGAWRLSKHPKFGACPWWEEERERGEEKGNRCTRMHAHHDTRARACTGFRV